MCIPKIPPLPEKRNPPDREGAAKSSAARVLQNRARQARGVFSNIFSSATGDDDYNASTTSRRTATR